MSFLTVLAIISLLLFSLFGKTKKCCLLCSQIQNEVFTFLRTSLSSKSLMFLQTKKHRLVRHSKIAESTMSFHRSFSEGWNKRGVHLVSVTELLINIAFDHMFQRTGYENRLSFISKFGKYSRYQFLVSDYKYFKGNTGNLSIYDDADFFPTIVLCTLFKLIPDLL